ncbi:MAG: hypothetical protein M5U28_35980 [Sandaracinaceae bacterium]|nr:hypothetical protein [Sandaracinaceae bacterium]
MEFFKPGLLIDFMRHRRIYMLVSGLLVLASLISVFYPGPNFGTDFVGGTEVQVRFSGDVSSAELRGALGELGYQGAEVVAVVDSPNEYIIRVRDFSAIDEEQRQRIEEIVTGALPEGIELERIRIPEGGDSARIDLSGEIEPSAISEALDGAGISVLRVVRVGQAQDHVYEAQLAGVAEEMMGGLGRELGEARSPEQPERVGGSGPAQARSSATPRSRACCTRSRSSWSTSRSASIFASRPVV